MTAQDLKRMLVICVISFFICLGLAFADLYLRNWANFCRDFFTAVSFAVIWATWFVLFK